MSATGRPGASGFTLIEMLVVLAILGLVGGVIYPGLTHGLRSQELRSAASTAATALREGRALAVRSDAPVRVGARADGGGLTVGREAPRPVAGSIRIATSPANGIIFYADGSSTGGTLVVADAERRIRLDVAPTTGLLRSAAG